MNVQSAISKCDMARAILLALLSYKKATSADLDVVQSLSFAVETFLDDAKKECANPELSATNTSENNPEPQLYAPYDGDMTISARIHLARENLGLSKFDLAGMLNLTPECIADWEEETGPVEATYIIPLANALKCDPMWLLDGRSGSTSTLLTPVNIMQGVDMSTIGVRINAARVSLGMSPDELECELNAPEGTVFRWETRKATPSGKYIDELAKILKTSVTWLLTGKEVEVSHE